MPDPTGPLDRRLVEAAIRHGADRRGATWPNPAVGALVVRDGVVVGRGRTGAGGRPHGEAVAIERAGAAAAGATLYVSLEPCAHHGGTPPCTDAIVGAGIARVVAGRTDPDPRVSGRGFRQLRDRGIALAADVAAAAAARAHRGHTTRVAHGRPNVTLKLAVSADDAIGREGAGQVQITGERAGRHVQALRARFDAILVGRGTIAADDPELTCRLPGLEHRSPVRIVVGDPAAIDDAARVMDTKSPVPTWFLSAGGSDRGSVGERFRTLVAGRGPGGVDLRTGLRRLGEAGITLLIVEGGARIARSLIEADLVDEVMLFRSNARVGEGAVPALAGLSLDAIGRSPAFRVAARRRFGDDWLVRYERAAGSTPSEGSC